MVETVTAIVIMAGLTVTQRTVTSSLPSMDPYPGCQVGVLSAERHPYCPFPCKWQPRRPHPLETLWAPGKAPGCPRSINQHSQKPLLSWEMRPRAPKEPDLVSSGLIG